jgi:hypothetical protein
MRPVAAIAVATLLAACANAAPPDAADVDAREFVAWDSAGVVMAENRADTAALPRLRLGAPLLRLGVVEGPRELQFTSVVGAALLDDGTLVVADNEAMQLRWFAADGTHLRSAGRRGDGPGEFRQIFSLARIGPDSVVVWDTALRRATVFDRNGHVARTVRLEAPTGGPAASYSLRPVHPADSGWISVAHGFVPPPLHIAGPLIRRSPILVLRHNGAGAVVDTIARGDADELLVPAERLLPNQYGNARFMTPHGALRTYVAPGAGRVHVARSDAFRIESFAGDGRLLRVVTFPRQEYEYTAAEFEERRSRSIGSAPTEERARSVAEMMNPRFRPARRPTLTDLRVDADGRLWVREWGVAGDEPARWLVLDADGRADAVAEIPRGIELLYLAADAAVVTTRDELGVPFVTVHGWTRR